MTSTPQRIQEAADASLRVLRSLKDARVTPRELLRARRTLLARHETDLKDNAYRLGLLTHLQCDAVPLKVPAAVRDLRRAYEAATVEDVHDAYAQARQGWVGWEPWPGAAELVGATRAGGRHQGGRAPPGRAGTRPARCRVGVGGGAGGRAVRAPPPPRVPTLCPPTHLFCTLFSFPPASLTVEAG